MSKKIGVMLALVGLCALSLFLLNCGSSSSRPSGLLYVLTQGNGGVGNAVTSYAIDLGSGNLSLINSNASTCTTSGTSCGPPLSIVLDPKGATAFVLNQGVPSASVAPTIYGYTVKSDGSFGAPTVAATLTVGDTAIAMARDAAGQFLYVIDRGLDPSATNCGAPPNLANVNCASISVFAIQAGSTSLNAVTGSPFPVGRIPTAISVLSFSPPAGANLACATTTDFLYVTFNSDPALHNDSTLSTYCVDSSGKPNDLTPNSPYATSTDPLSVQAVDTNLAGQPNSGGIFVYVGTQPAAAGALNIFQVCTVVGQQNCSAQAVANLTLLPVTTPPPPAPGANPVAMLVDPTNSFLYVVCEGSSQVFGYKITTSSGVLTALNPANRNTGSQPVALALHPSTKSSGEFLYVSNSTASNISGFAVSTSSGSMSSLAGFPVTSPSSPGGMAAR
jgi:6-phosphogluconolactonase (cycloisomerase 2 family)